MKPLFVASSTKFTGKNLVSLGLGLHFKNKGLRVGYFKPYGPTPVDNGGTLVDEDAEFFKRSLALDDPLDKICPILLSEPFLLGAFKNGATNVRDTILQSYKTVSQGKDLVLVGGVGNLHAGEMFGLSTLDLARELDGLIVLVERFDDDLSTGDACIEASRAADGLLAGVVYNRISRRRLNCIDECVKPFLARNDIRLLGAIPKDQTLSAVPVRDIVEKLNGDVLCCNDKLDELVERLSIGAMTEDSALKYFRAVRNKAVFTGGDRSDIQLAALETSTKCLVLTGGYYPNSRILGRASEKGVPVMVVHHDTATAVDTIDELMAHTSLHSDAKTQRALQIVEENVDIPAIAGLLGVKG